MTATPRHRSVTAVAAASILLAAPAAQAMCALAPADNKAVVSEAIDTLWNAGDLSAIEAFFAPDFREHGSDPLLPIGHEGLRISYQAMRMAFPDLQVAIQDQIGDGDLVATRVVLYGTNLGPLEGAAPTGNPILVRAMRFDRVCDGLITEHWAVVDGAAMAAQLRSDSAVTD